MDPHVPWRAMLHRVIAVTPSFAGLPSELWVQQVADGVAQQVPPEHEEEDREAGERDGPPTTVEDPVPPIADHEAPFRGPGLCPEADEAQGGCDEDRRAEIHRRDDEERADCVRHDMAEDDVPRRHANGPGRLDE